jgi:transposase
MTKRQKFSTEFKVEAVKLAESIGVPKAAKELGILENNIRRWQVSSKTKPITDSEKPSYDDLESEVRKLRREMEYMKKINEVLKKSTAIFSQQGMDDWK